MVAEKSAPAPLRPVLESLYHITEKSMPPQEYKASVTYAGDEFFIGMPPSGHAHVIDVKGDRRAAANPVEMLLVAVAGCTAADVVSILKKTRQDVTDYRVEVTGTRADEHPRKFLTFHLHHIVYGRGVSDKAVADAIELSDTKYCSVAATVRPTATITTSFEIIDVPHPEANLTAAGQTNTAA
jgi:putative redox protein